jgi:hypothetical protein
MRKLGDSALDRCLSQATGLTFSGQEAALSSRWPLATLPSPRSRASGRRRTRINEPANLNEDLRMLFRTSPALCLAAFALLIPPMAGGCSLITTVAYLVAPEKDAPAEFKGLRGKHVAVVCKPIVELEFSDASSARELATMVGSQLAMNVRKARVIDQREVARWIDENAWVDYPTLGKALDADIVVGIDLEQFRMHEGSTLYRGRATANVRVYDVAEKKVVFEKRIDNFTFPGDSAVPAQDQSEPQFRALFLQVLSGKIARSFHAYDSRATFAEENLTF